MQVIGHRGCRDEYPQNTVDAVQGAAPHVDMVEIDVRRCGSGELVVFHDDRVDDLTDGRGAVERLSYDDLASLSVEGSDASPPLLADVLSVLPDGTGLNVELKHDGMAADIAPLLRSLDREVIVSSFEPDALVPFGDEPVSTAYLFFGFFEESVETAAELGCEYVHPLYEITDRAAVQSAHDHGMGVNPWTVPTSDEVRRLRDAGVDGVIVDSWTVVPAWFDSPAELEESVLKSL